jgi:hypothetical protein
MLIITAVDLSSTTPRTAGQAVIPFFASCRPEENFMLTMNS